MNISALDRAAAITRFLRSPTLGRSVVGLLTAALLLLLFANMSTFVMIQRTAEFNTTVEQSHNVRLLASSVLVDLVNAETGQRGYLLTGRTAFLAVHEEAQRDLPGTLAELRRATDGTPELEAGVATLTRLSRDRLVIMQQTIELARQGRIGEAVQLTRSGQGKVVMDDLRAEIANLDRIEAGRLQSRRAQSERAWAATVVVNAVSGVLILVLAGISLVLIRRYVTELNGARDALDRTNAGLEETVRHRTAELTRANEEIQRFAYIVSHDLRAPLVNVMGYTAEMEQSGKSLERQLAAIEKSRPSLIDQEAVAAVREDLPEAIGFIRASTAKMDRLINAILKLSREGRRNLAPEPIDVAVMAQGIADSIRHQTDAADAEVVIDPLPAFESDRLSLEQIFGNLIDNAVKYLEPGRPGRVVIAGEDVAGGWVEFRVSDNGRGVSQRDHERIFELFRRSGRQDRPGEGLGLAFVRNSVRRIGGTIDLESELGKGSTFILRFPKRLVVAEAGDSE